MGDRGYIGDSLTKQWRSVQPQVSGIPEVFRTYFGNYSAAILGVGGTARQLNLGSYGPSESVAPCKTDCN